MKNLFIIVMIVMSVMLSADSAQAAGSVELPGSSDYKVDPNYPAIIDGTNGRGFLVHADQILSISMTAFLMRYDRPPSSWQEVVDKGYASERYLMAPDGRKIDPDDGRLDFEFDITYLFNPIKKKGRILKWWGIINQKKDMEVVSPLSFADQLEDQLMFGVQHGFDYWEHIGDEQLFFERNAIYQLMQRSIWYFHDVHHRYPASLQELFQSGLCSLGYDPVNPVTGLKLSESTGDTLEYVPGNNTFWLFYLDEDGKRITMLGQPFAEGTEAQ